MANIDEIAADVRNHFGCCDIQNEYENYSGKKCAYFVSDDNKVIVFYYGVGTDVMPFQFFNLWSAKIIDDFTVTEEIVEEDDKAHTWMSALIGALFGWFIYSKRSNVYVQKVTHHHYQLKINLRGIPLESTIIDFAEDIEPAIKCRDIINNIIDKYKNDKQADNEIIKNAYTKQFGEFVNVWMDDKPMDFWCCLSDKKYFDEACVKDIACIPKPVFDEALSKYTEKSEKDQLLFKTAKNN